MPKRILFISFIILHLTAWAIVLTTITGTGNWSDPANWSGGNIGDDISEDVTMNNNTGIINVQNGDNFTIGDFDMTNGNTLNIENGGVLNVGAMTSNKITTGNNVVITVSGVLEIWGDLIVSNNLILTTLGTGMIIIHGNIDMGNNAVLDIQGSVQVDGDFLAGTNTSVDVSGSLNIDGDAVVGNNSVLTGSGSVNIGGTCTGPATFCSSGPLPVELLFFTAEVIKNHVILKWATASEENFDFFTIERSRDAREFYSIGSLSGNNFSNSIINYGFIDSLPPLGRAFYRLKATDFDGSIEYFEIKMVVFEPVDYQLYPNPLLGTMLTVWAGVNKNHITTLSIFNEIGQEILKTLIQPGINRIELEHYDLPSGLYIVNIGVEGRQEQRKLIIK